MEVTTTETVSSLKLSASLPPALPPSLPPSLPPHLQVPSFLWGQQAEGGQLTSESLDADHELRHIGAREGGREGG